MSWHRFYVSIPFTILMWSWFMYLGYIGMNGRITKRNATIATIGAALWMLLANLP
jgi:hypothetical protein